MKKRQREGIRKLVTQGKGTLKLQEEGDTGLSHYRIAEFTKVTPSHRLKGFDTFIYAEKRVRSSSDLTRP